MTLTIHAMPPHSRNFSERMGMPILYCIESQLKKKKHLQNAPLTNVGILLVQDSFALTFAFWNAKPTNQMVNL